MVLIPIAFDETLFYGVESTLEWLNTKPPEDQWKSVKGALCKHEFKLRKIKHNNKPNSLEYSRF
jgi:hypothetical protein